MASDSLQLDDIMATLMSMGFEWNDCQEAVTNGKLTVQAAIDWILSGKPGNVVQPALKLNTGQNSGPLQSSSSNPFVASNVAGLRGSSTIDSSTSQGTDVHPDTIISRSHMSEKQQQIKLDFEEKERQEVKRKMHEEKLKKKKDKERILKEIQEDREKLRLTKQAKVDFSPESTGSQETASAAKASQLPPDPEKTSNTANIQIRLPNGQMFRQSFSSCSTLNTVWDAVYNTRKTNMNAYSGFIQPFPRREFTKEEMGETLQSLGLVPSGSLVLKKKDVQQATAMETEAVPASGTPQAFQMGQPGPIGGDEEANDDPDEEMQDPFNPQHQWGRGFMVGDRLGQERQEQMDDAGDEDMQVLNPLDVIPGLGNHPILGHQHNNDENQHAFEGFGNRLIPEGVPGDDAHLNRSAAEMAAQAAAHRFAVNPQEPAAVEGRPQSSSEHHYHLYTMGSLQTLTMCVLARSLADPCKPFMSLSGLPEEILQDFLKHLIKERLLKPKLLQLMPCYLLKLVLDYYPYTTNEMLHSARIFTHLHTLSLNSCTLITDAGLNYIKGMTALKVINLSGCSQITNHCFTVFSAFPSLHSLLLEGSGVTDAGVMQFAESHACPQLVHLDLSRTSVTQDIFPALQGFKKLKSLFLKQCQVSGLAGIESVSRLETLDLSETGIRTDSVLCLTRLPCLVNVSLTGTQFVQGDLALSYLKDLKLTSLFLPVRSTTTDLGMAYISGFSLSALDLTNYTNVGNVGMEHIGKIHSLKKLLLTNTKVSDEGIQHLQDLINLQVLFLDKTCVSNACADVIARFKSLCELSLSTTNITSDFLKQEALNKCINLTKLNLGRTIIGDKGILFLKLPNLQLLNLDCTRVHPYSVPDIQRNCPNLKSVTIVNLSSVPEDQVEEN
ncbi:hypothetical protein EGW08_018434 [Elysia chlorotica]|uniref:UBX domain-containing protein 4 n=1 Tax=Elysia chlorotica TaxID=188477 RepID=A0A433SWW6_ELYCH|nr:hypothetical protein EGW08_018434 [Elysia chlorotica]